MSTSSARDHARGCPVSICRSVCLLHQHMWARRDIHQYRWYPYTHGKVRRKYVSVVRCLSAELSNGVVGNLGHVLRFTPFTGNSRHILGRHLPVRRFGCIGNLREGQHLLTAQFVHRRYTCAPGRQCTADTEILDRIEPFTSGYPEKRTWKPQSSHSSKFGSHGGTS